MEASSRGRILVVDDNAVVRKALEGSLATAGYETTAAASGQQALVGVVTAQENHQAFDLVLLDVEMPDLSGLAVLRGLRQRASAIELPVIMVTARHDSADVVEAFREKANDYVTKPVDFGVLFARMDTHIALKRSHEALRSSHRSLLHAARMESVVQLAGGVAQELRGPLSQVQMGLTAVRAGITTERPQMTEMLDRMKQSLQEADGIVSRLVVYSTSERLRLEAVPVAAIVREALAALEGTLATAGVELAWQLDDGHREAMIAREEMRQVLVNLVLNSLHAVGKGGRIIVRTGERRVEGANESDATRIGARVRNDQTAVVIEVEDSGPGMSEDEMARAFDPFFKGRAAGDGPGLGLTVSRQLVDLHGGLIQLRNRTFGHGLIVSVLLRKRPTAKV